jgi:outer membrane protein insertion porin family
MFRFTLHAHCLAIDGLGIMLLALISITAARAQSASIDPSLYEGQKLNAVDLIANPHRNTDQLQPLLAQQSGEPFSQENVKASIQALEQQGFRNVTAETVSDSSGLRLNFILERPYYVGLIEFPDLDKRFPYAQLLRVVDLPEQDPYSKARLPGAQAALITFLHEHGYLNAQVSVAPQIDDDNQLVAVTFRTELGARARIQSIQISGLASDQQRTSLLKALRSIRAKFAGARLKPGHYYSLDREAGAAAFLKHILTNQGYLSSVVDSTRQYDPGKNTVDVMYQVDLGQVVKIYVEGARLSLIPYVSRRQAKKLVPAYSEGIHPEIVQEGERNLAEHFQAKSYYDVRVRTEVRPSSNKTVLVYAIDRGKKHKLQKIVFAGVHQVSEKDLLAHVVLKTARIWSRGRITPQLVTQSADSLKAFYQDRGFEGIKVTPTVTDRDPQIEVTFEIEEGPQTLVESVRVTGNEHLPADKLTDVAGLQLKTGMPFSQRGVLEDRNRLLAAYLNLGYPNAEVETSVERPASDPTRANVVYTVVERQQLRVSRVAYLGHKQTQLSLLQKATPIKIEEPLQQTALLHAESQLYGLNIFDWASVRPSRPIGDQTEEAMLVKVHESKRNEVSYGLGFELAHRAGNTPAGSVPVPGLPPIDLKNNEVAGSQATYAGVRGSIEFSRRNMRGLGETASAMVAFSPLDQQAVVSYSQPYFMGTQWSSLTSASLERNSENPLYVAGLGTGTFQIEKQLKPGGNTRLQLRYNINKTNLSNLLVPELVLPQDRNVLLSTFSGTLIRDGRDKPLDATKGTFTTLNLGLTPEALGSSATFAKFFGQYATYKPLHSVVFANSVRLGMAKALAGSFVPTSELFFSGGGTSIRSFPINQAGPQRIVPFCNVLEGETGCVDITVPVGGRLLFILNSELRFPLRIKKGLGAVLFYDGGNVYRAINFNDFIHNYTNTVGIGLRYATPIGPIRIDVGHNLNPVPGINPTQYYITLGQVF